jgi:hypothetical protein
MQLCASLASLASLCLCPVHASVAGAVSGYLHSWRSFVWLCHIPSCPCSPTRLLDHPLRRVCPPHMHPLDTVA